MQDARMFATLGNSCLFVHAQLSVGKSVSRFSHGLS